jgi:4-amino-4-deoxy-L-arabinose transferase-like glycosyltransferase
MEKNQNLQFFGAVLIAAVCFFAFLGSYALMDNNEGLYAGIPHWMVKSGNYILPRLNGLIYIEKPPLLYWLIALNFNLFGVSEWTARLVPAASGFLVALLLFWFLRRENRTSDGITAILLWSTSLGVILFSRVIFFDMLFTLFFSVLLIALYLFRKNRKKRIWLLLAYTMAALAVLTKGLLGVALPCLTVFVFVYCEQTSKTWYSLKRFSATLKEMFSYFSFTGMIIFFAITLPWHIAAAQQDPNFWHFYFVNEHFLRFLGQRQPEDYYDGPIYYYILRLLPYLAPWIIFLPAFFWRNKSQVPQKEKQTLERFCWVWFLTVLVFFSISKAKANYYIIPGIPPLIILFTFHLREAKEFIYTKLIFIILTVVFCIVPPVLLLLWLSPVILKRLGPLVNPYPWALTLQQKFLPFTNYLKYMGLPLTIMILFSITALLIIWYFRKHKNVRQYYIWTLALFVALVTAVGTSQLHLFENQYSSKKIITEICQTHKKQNIDLHMYIDFEEISTTPYYFEQPAVMIDWNSNDLWYGMHKPDSKSYKIKLEEFLKRPQNRPSFVLMEERRREGFKRKSAAAGYTLWKHYGRIVVFYRKSLKPNQLAQQHLEP